MKVGGNDDVVLPFDNNDDNDNNGNNDNDFYPHINEVDCDNDIDDNSDNDNNYNNDNNDNNIWTMTPMITMKMNFFLTILLFPPPRGCAARCSWFTRVSHNTTEGVKFVQTMEIKEVKTEEERKNNSHSAAHA